MGIEEGGGGYVKRQFRVGSLTLAGGDEGGLCAEGEGWWGLSGSERGVDLKRERGGLEMGWVERRKSLKWFGSLVAGGGRLVAQSLDSRCGEYGRRPVCRVQCAASADAACCDGRCSALRWHLHRTAIFHWEYCLVKSIALIPALLSLSNPR